MRSGGYVGYTGTLTHPALKMAKAACTHGGQSAMRKIGWLPVTRCVIVEGTRRSRMARARATRRKQEERPMIDEKKAQEVLGQVTGKTAATLTVWADANQRVLREVVELGAVTAKESVRRFSELKPTAI